MPNTNPAGKNQPLDRGPIPVRERSLLSGDQLLINNVVSGTDVNAITIPTDSDVVREIGAISLVRATATTAAIISVDLVYQDANGNEAIIGTANLANAAGADITIPLNAPFFVTSEDTGVVLRVSNTAVEADGVDAVCEWTDVRGVERTVVTLVSATAVGVLPSSIEEGEAVGIVHGTVAQDEGTPSCWLLNYDDTTHGTLTAAVTEEGGGSAQLTTGNPSAIAGGSARIFSPEGATGFHQTGGNLAITDSSAFGTGTAPVIMTATYRTNLGEVAPDQASAF